MSKVSKRPSVIMPTREEDKAITAAARNDPDAQPLTSKQLKAMAPMRSLRSFQGVPSHLRPQRGGGDSFETASHAHPGFRLRTFEAHQKQAAFTLDLDVEDVPGSCRRKDHTPLGISRRGRHGGMVPPNRGERKRGGASGPRVPRKLSRAKPSGLRVVRRGLPFYL